MLPQVVLFALAVVLFPGFSVATVPVPELRHRPSPLPVPWTAPRGKPLPRAIAPAPDTIKGIGEVIRVLRDRYEEIGPPVPKSDERLDGEQGVLGDRDIFCDGGKGQLCHGGDPDLGSCRAGASCHPTEEFFLEVLQREAERYPMSGLIMGQAVYALVKFHQPNLAMLLVQGCEAESWLCDALEGYVLHAMDRSLEAEGAFRRGMAQAPFPERCAYGDALWLLGEWDEQYAGRRDLPESREKTRDWPCLDRLEASDTLWWLADPLYSVEGNERWVEHMSRALDLRFHLEMRELYRGRPALREDLERVWAERIRRGVWDSYRNPPGQRSTSWTSEDRARYHFIPNVSPDHLVDPTWQLNGGLWYEGFTPPGVPFFSIPVQTARFRAGDSLLVAVAGALVDSPLEEASGISAHLVFTDRPGSFPLHHTGTPVQGTSRFLGLVGAKEHILGLEIQSSEGIGWYRGTLSPLSPTNPELSDLLLFSTPQGERPDSLLDAVAHMLGSTHIQAREGVSVYWETYGAAPDTELELELALLRESGGGFLNRVRGVFGGGGQEAYGPVRWTEVALGEVDPGVLTLNLSGLENGEYEMVLKVRWNGQEPLERRQRIRVGDG